MRTRHITRLYTVPPLAPGFVGPGHLAAQVLSPSDFALNDPFIMLADDHLDIGDRPVGGAHPHAGFETVTLILDGAIYDRDEGGIINAGEVQWMTAGRGVIHSENVATRGRVRLLQLWLTLPKAQRWIDPGFQDIHADAIPIRREPGVEARVYSGSSGDARSDTRNHVPVTLVEMKLERGATIDQTLPGAFNGFLFVIDGSVHVADSVVEAGQVGWLDPPVSESGPSLLRVAAGDDGARAILYAGEPQHDRIVSHGPFIGDTNDDIARLYREYRAGTFVRLSELTRESNRASTTTVR